MHRRVALAAPGGERAEARDDAARLVIERLIAEFPQHELQLVIDSRMIGANPKNCNLANIYPAARHDVIVMVDSDVRVEPDFLAGVVAAEAQLHADSAAIGIATARLYPDITLSASLGQQSPDSGSLLRSANRFWSLAADLSAPILHGGTLRAQRRAAIDLYRASLATYEQTVLQGLQQVADTLQSLAQDAELVDAQRQLIDSASSALALQRESYAAGKSDVLQLISAERAYQQALLGSVRAQAQRLQDSAQLFVALGGGWWDAKLLPPSPDRR